MNRSDKEFIVQKIRTQYTEKETTELDGLKALDKRVKRPATIFAYVLGALGAIIMGMGMSLVMTDIGETLGISAPTVPGVIIGAVGFLLALATYPLYAKILRARKAEFAPEIMRLSDSLIEKH